MAAGELPAGWGVLVTRPADQADTLCRLIEAAGGEAIRLPLLEIAPVAPDSAGPLRLQNLGRVDWLVFTSTNAVRHAFGLCGVEWLQGSGVKIAAIGQATTRALDEQGVAVDLKPKQQFNSEALLAEPAWAKVAGQRFLIVRGVGGRELLAETLQARGAQVEYAEVYQRSQSNPDMGEVLTRWRSGSISAVTVTSGEALANLLRLMAGGNLGLLLSTPLIVIGERLAEQARNAGCTEVVAAGAGDADIFNAVARIGHALIKSHQP
jgi:uroporphyrinogen-III synthase